jgi:tetratricopeptide (TPR) repeat protein
MVAARIAESEQHPAEVIAQLQEAVKAEDRLAYDEPRNWFAPSRHALGAALLAQHRAREAEAVYRADLAHNPDNGWALFGLRAALEAQHRSQEASRSAQAFTRVWAGADTALTASSF